MSIVFCQNNFKFDTGAVNITATPVPAGFSWYGSVINNNLVTLNIVIPATTCTASSVFINGITNALPLYLRPKSTVSNVCYAQDITTAGNSQTCTILVGPTGLITGILSANATNGEQYQMNCTLVYNI